MDKMISTRALYGDYLAHARTYSHKYIKREPDGKGGWVYTYPTDARVSRQVLIIGRKGTQPRLGSETSTVTQYNVGRSSQPLRSLNDMNTRGTREVDIRNARVTAQTHYREADKASQIYKEGQSENSLDKKDNTKFQQAISSGKKFLSNFIDAISHPITENYTIKDTNNNVIASGTRNSNLSEVGKNLINAGKKWLSNIITTKKTITITDK